MFFIDPYYLLFIAIPALVISAFTQMYLKSTFAKWSRVPNTEGMTGMEVANTLFSRTSLNPIPLERAGGNLTDHYDPGANVVRLSDPIATQPSIAAMAVAAHELGHVQQYQTGSGLIAMRSALLPALQFTPTISYISFTLGLLFNMAGLIWVGILFFGFMVLFSLLTLPVEFDASRRGLTLLKQAGLTDTAEEVAGARAVLTAAALTYIGAAITSVLQLLYYVSLARRSERY
ncbi:MAG TPA: zinc metallopeptidase [Leptolyngbyaceae cyanobacterium M33_DOE_097]|uniref:Zinc metallopeptidase n=1 Tax=Oscillatoriales cyanobacterium SpSt-418 TaxID=2282169 RepID=A0A7C3KEU7_9CYAN|nr:zinc metallopeptidase [Leptolyngbyaceae cyanobacterium M33_DOE_097]